KKANEIIIENKQDQRPRTNSHEHKNQGVQQHKCDNNAKY
ncbi:MAG: hypothetical protein ACI8RD_014213, partial [Bacillariaceae sp.]